MSESGESRSRDVHPLYQRLLGGAVLLALAAIIIPAVFDLSHDPEQKIRETNIPPQPEGMKVEVLPLPPPEPIVVPRADIEANIAAQRPHFNVIDGQKGVPAAKTSPVVSEPLAAQVKPEPEKSAPSKAPAVVAGATGSWVVQVGSFGSESNAKALKTKIEKAGFSARVFAESVAGKTVNRVWAGPVGSKDLADALRRDLLDKLKLKGLVLNRPGVSGSE
ncbi:MAG: hypothetical protein GC138_04705 [Gammaproteobacteria bacterium]|nr:hypothetical protein [Gammaproteobacteria bacterium]